MKGCPGNQISRALSRPGSALALLGRQGDLRTAHRRFAPRDGGQDLILGEPHLRAVLADYQEHCSTARPHQSIDQRAPGSEQHAPLAAAMDAASQQIRRKPVLTGLINEYMRAA